MTIVTKVDDFGRLYLRDENDGVIFRELVPPGHWEGGIWVKTDMSGYEKEVQDIAAEKWTDAVVSAYQAEFPWVPEPVLGPADYRLTKRQIKRALIELGISNDPDGFIRGVIGKIPDAKQQALALTDWEDAPYYDRKNPLFNDPALLAAAGMSPAQVDMIWMHAKDLPA